MNRPRSWLCLLLAFALLSSGCSLVFMQRGSDRAEPGGSVKCTQDTDMPWWDVVLTGIDGAIGTGTTIATLAADSGERTGRLTVGLIFLALGGAHAYSALKGFGWAKKCKEESQSHTASGAGWAMPTSTSSRTR